MAWTNVEKTSALIGNLKSGHELNCHVEYFHLLVGMVPKDKEKEREDE